MGNAGQNKGGIFAQNLKAGEIDFASTDASKSVSFEEVMKDTPVVVVTNNADNNVFLSARSESGFTVDRATTGSANTVTWVAFNDNR